MQVNETLNEGLKRGYAITVTAAELEAKVNEKLAEAQPEVEMKGFRKGKVPMALLKKQFGQKVMGEAMQESIDGAMQEHFEKSGDRPAMQPDVKMANEDWKEGDDVEVTMTYEALPEIPEVDLSSITLEKMVVKADDAAVEEALANLAETAQDFEAREEGAKAEDGDQITFDFLGKVDGEAFEGGAAEDYPLVLGSNSFIPGFEEQLVGVVAGDAHHPAFLVEVGVKMRLGRHDVVPLGLPSNTAVQRLLRRGEPIHIPVFAGHLRLAVEWEHVAEQRVFHRQVHRLDIGQHSLHFPVKGFPLRLTPKVVRHEKAAAAQVFAKALHLILTKGH